MFKWQNLVCWQKQSGEFKNRQCLGSPLSIFTHSYLLVNIDRGSSNGKKFFISNAKWISHVPIKIKSLLFPFSWMWLPNLFNTSLIGWSFFRQCLEAFITPILIMEFSIGLIFILKWDRTLIYIIGFTNAF